MMMHHMSSCDAVIAAIGFVIQVYCDFSGYTDIGRGSALLLGIRLPENFDLPYLSHDLADFWRRWHMYARYMAARLRLYSFRRIARRALFQLAQLVSHHGGVRIVARRQLALCRLRRHAGHRARGQSRMEELPQSGKTAGSRSGNIAGRVFGTFLTMAFITVSYAVFRAPDMDRAANLLGSVLTFSGDSTLWLSRFALGHSAIARRLWRVLAQH